jgi:hypothetical protein
VFLYQHVLEIDLARFDAVRCGGRNASPGCWRPKKSDGQRTLKIGN